MQLVWPAEAYLEGVRDALARGWPPDSQRGADAARGELALIHGRAPSRRYRIALD